MNLYVASILSVLVSSVIFVFFPWKAKRLPTHYDDARAALDKKERWTTWLTGLESAAIAAMVLITKDRQVCDEQRLPGFLALLFFGFSIVIATWMLSGIPSVQQRLKRDPNPEEANDIYGIRLFDVIPPTLGRFSAVIHTYFVIGMVFFTWFIISWYARE